LVLSRRLFVNLALAGLASWSAGARLALGRTQSIDDKIAPSLLRRALDALEQHHASISYRDFIGVADFSLPSRAPRFHLVNLADGGVACSVEARAASPSPMLACPKSWHGLGQVA
jgi:hypothetical protein